MGWVELDVPSVSAAVSEAESRRFGRSVARVTLGARWRESFGDEEAAVAALVAEAVGSEAELVVVRAPTELVSLGAALTHAGRPAIAAGTLLYWEIEPARLAPAARAAKTAFAAGMPAERIDAVADAVHEIFEDYRNHYRYNPHLDARVVADGYREWAASRFRSASGVLSVVEDAGEIAAAASSEVAPRGDILEIELAGVRPAFRRAGHYRTLFRSIGAFAQEHAISRIVISTQAANTGVQRAWASEGLQPFAAIDTFHLDLAGLSR